MEKLVLKLEAIKWYNEEKKKLQEDIKKYNKDIKGSRYDDIQLRIVAIDYCIWNILKE